MRTRLTSWQSDCFNKNGFLLVKKFFTNDQATNARIWPSAQDYTKFAKTWVGEEPGADIKNQIYTWSSNVNSKAALCGAVEYIQRKKLNVN